MTFMMMMTMMKMAVKSTNDDHRVETIQLQEKSITQFGKWLQYDNNAMKYHWYTKTDH